MKNFAAIVLVCGLVLALSGAANAGFMDGLVAHYGFENAGDLGADTQGVYDGTVMGSSPTQVPGKVGFAMDFERDNGNFVDLPDGFADFTTGITVAAWVYNESFTNWARVMDFGNGAGVDNILLARRGTSDDGRWEFHDTLGGGESKDSNDFYVIGAWQLVVGTCDDGATNAATMKFYVDGSPISTWTDGSVPGNVVRTRNYIGESNWGGDDFWDGMMDEVSIWNRALSDAEVLEMWNGGAGKNIIIDGTLISDVTGNWNNASTWTGAPPATPTTQTIVQVIDTDVVTVATPGNAFSLDIDAAAEVVVDDILTVSSDITGAGTLTVNGGKTIGASTAQVGTLDLGAAAIVNIDEVTVGLGGSLITGGAVTLNGNLTWDGGTTLTTGGLLTMGTYLQISGTAGGELAATEYIFEGGTFNGTMADATPSPVTINGGNVTIAGGPHTYTGPTVMNSGTAAISGQITATEYLLLYGGTMTLTADVTTTGGTDVRVGPDEVTRTFWGEDQTRSDHYIQRIRGLGDGGYFATPAENVFFEGGDMYFDDPSPFGGHGDRYGVVFSGYFKALANGVHTFSTHGDDYELLWIDLDQDGVFEIAGDLGDERITRNLQSEGDGWNERKTGTASLTQDAVYAFAVGGFENGGGQWVELDYEGPGGGGLVAAGGTNQPGQWSRDFRANLHTAIRPDATLDIAGAATLYTGGVEVLGTLVLTSPEAVDDNVTESPVTVKPNGLLQIAAVQSHPSRIHVEAMGLLTGPLTNQAFGAPGPNVISFDEDAGVILAPGETNLPTFGQIGGAKIMLGATSAGYSVEVFQDVESLGDTAFKGVFFAPGIYPGGDYTGTLTSGGAADIHIGLLTDMTFNGATLNSASTTTRVRTDSKLTLAAATAGTSTTLEISGFYDLDDGSNQNTTAMPILRLEIGSIGSGQTVRVIKGLVDTRDELAIDAGGTLEIGFMAGLDLRDDPDHDRRADRIMQGTVNVLAGGLVMINNWERMVNGTVDFNLDPDAYVYLRDNLNGDNQTPNQADPDADPGLDGLWATYDAGERNGFDNVNIIIGADQFGKNAVGGGGLFMGAGRRLTVGWEQGHGLHADNTIIRKSASADPTGGFVIFSSSGAGFGSNNRGGDLDINCPVILPGVDIYINDPVGTYINLPMNEGDLWLLPVASDGRVRMDGAEIQAHDLIVRQGRLRLGDAERDADVTFTGKAEVWDNAELRIRASRAYNEPTSMRFQVENDTLFPGGLFVDQGGYLRVYYLGDGAGKTIPLTINVRNTGDVPGLGRLWSGDPQTILHFDEEGPGGNVIFPNIILEAGVHVGIKESSLNREELRLGLQLKGDATIERENNEFSLQDVTAIAGDWTLTTDRDGNGGNINIYGTIGVGPNDVHLLPTDTNFDFMPGSDLLPGSTVSNLGSQTPGVPGADGRIRIFAGRDGTGAITGGLIRLAGNQDLEITVDEDPAVQIVNNMGATINVLDAGQIIIQRGNDNTVAGMVVLPSVILDGAASAKVTRNNDQLYNVLSLDMGVGGTFDAGGENLAPNTIIGSGSITNAASVTVDTLVAPGGSIGDLSIDGDFTLLDGTDYEWDLGPGLDNNDRIMILGDRSIIIGETALGWTMKVIDAGGAQADPDQRYTILGYQTPLSLSVLIEQPVFDVTAAPGFDASAAVVMDDLAGDVYITGLTSLTNFVWAGAGGEGWETIGKWDPVLTEIPNGVDSYALIDNGTKAVVGIANAAAFAVKIGETTAGSELEILNAMGLGITGTLRVKDNGTLTNNGLLTALKAEISGVANVGATGTMTVAEMVDVAAAGSFTVLGSFSAKELNSAGTTDFLGATGGAVQTANITNGTTTFGAQPTFTTVNITDNGGATSTAGFAVPNLAIDTTGAVDFTIPVPISGTARFDAPRTPVSIDAGTFSVSGLTAQTERTLILSGNILSVGEAPSPSIAGQQLHLDAGAIMGLSDGETVAQWQDLSGQGHNTTSIEGDPEYQSDGGAALNNQPVVRFDGNDGFYLGNLGSSFPSAATLFIVTNFDDVHYNLFTTRNNDSWWRYHGNSNGYCGAFRNGRVNQQPRPMPSSGTFIFEVRSDGTAWELFQDGANILTYGADYRDGDNYRIAMHDNGNADKFLSGDIAEIIAYDTVLSAADSQAVGAFLSVKYGLDTGYGVDADLRTVPTHVAVVDDSTLNSLFNTLMADLSISPGKTLTTTGGSVGFLNTSLGLGSKVNATGAPLDLGLVATAGNSFIGGSGQVGATGLNDGGTPAGILSTVDTVTFTLPENNALDSTVVVGATTFNVGAGTTLVASGAVPLGEGAEASPTLNMTGGLFDVTGEMVLTEGQLAMSGFMYDGTDYDTRGRLENPGSLLYLTPVGTTTLTNRNFDINGDGQFRALIPEITRNDYYQTLFEGYFKTTDAGNYFFNSDNKDDLVSMYLDLNKDNQFTADEQIFWMNSDKTVALDADTFYKVAFAHGEGTGGSRIRVLFSDKDGATINNQLVDFNNAAHRAFWYSGAPDEIDLTATAVTVTAGLTSTINANTNVQANFGPLTLDTSTQLTTTGDAISFASTTFPGGGGAEITVDNDTNLGDVSTSGGTNIISGEGNASMDTFTDQAIAAILEKRGTGTAALPFNNSLDGNIAAGAITFSVLEGTLKGTGSAPFGAAGEAGGSGVTVHMGGGLLDLAGVPGTPTVPRTFDFEDGTLNYWNIEVSPWGGNEVYADGANPTGTNVPGGHGSFWINTWHGNNGNGDNRTGILTSDTFVVAADGGTEQITVYVGGGGSWGGAPGVDDPDVLEIDWCFLSLEHLVATGPDDWAMIEAENGGNWSVSQRTWDISGYVGETMRIRAYDTRTGGNWAFVTFDDIVTTNITMGGLVDPDVSEVAIVGIAGAGSEIAAGGLVPVTFGSLDMQADADLTTTGANLIFPAAQVSADGGAITTLTTDTDVTLGTGGGVGLDGNGNTFTLDKKGLETLYLLGTGANLDNATFDVQEGMLVALQASSPVGGATLSLSGADPDSAVIALGGDTGAATPYDVTYPNPIAFTNGMITTAGQDEVKTILTGPITPTSGLLKLRATDLRTIEMQPAGFGAGTGLIDIGTGSKVLLAGAGPYSFGGAIINAGGTLETDHNLTVRVLEVLDPTGVFDQTGVNKNLTVTEILTLQADYDLSGALVTVTGAAVTVGNNGTVTVGNSIDPASLDISDGGGLEYGANTLTVTDSLRTRQVAYTVAGAGGQVMTVQEAVVPGSIGANEPTTLILDGGGAGASLTISGVNPPPPLPGNTLIHYKFDETAGAVAGDETGNFDGTLHSNNADAHWTDDPERGQVLTFGTDNTWVEAPAVGGWRDEISYSVWLNPSATPGSYDCIIDSDGWGGGSIHYAIGSSGTASAFHLQVDVNGGGGKKASANPMVQGEWHHVVYTYKKNGTVEFYIDGVPDSSHAGIPDRTLNYTTMYEIGGWNNGRWFRGMMDDLMIYDVALDPAQVAELYQAGLGVGGAINVATDVHVLSNASSINAIGDVVMGNLTLENSDIITFGGSSDDMLTFATTTLVNPPTDVLDIDNDVNLHPTGSGNFNLGEMNDPVINKSGDGCLIITQAVTGYTGTPTYNINAGCLALLDTGLIGSTVNMGDGTTSKLSTPAGGGDKTYTETFTYTGDTTILAGMVIDPGSEDVAAVVISPAAAQDLNLPGNSLTLGTTEANYTLKINGNVNSNALVMSGPGGVNVTGNATADALAMQLESTGSANIGGVTTIAGEIGVDQGVVTLGGGGSGGTVHVTGGEFNINGPFNTTGGGGGVPGVTDALEHRGWNHENDGQLDLDGNGGLMGMTPSGGIVLLTNGPGDRGLDFDNDDDFKNSGAITATNQYMNVWIGILHIDADDEGTWGFRNAGDDDRAGIWFDIDNDGVFESSSPGLGDNRGEQLSWENTGWKDVQNLVAGDYMVAFTHREGGGGSRADFVFRSPTIPGETRVKPADAAQAGLWSPTAPGSLNWAAGTPGAPAIIVDNGIFDINATVITAGVKINGGLVDCTDGLVQIEPGGCLEGGGQKFTAGANPFQAGGADLADPTKLNIHLMGDVVTIGGSLIPRDHLLGEWTFNGATLEDTSGNGHDGTFHNGGVFSADTAPALAGGDSLDLRGGDFGVLCGEASKTAFNADRLTVSVWVKGWPDGGWEPYVAKRGEGEGWQLRRRGGGDRLCFTLRGTSGGDDPTGASNIIQQNTGDWFHIMATYDWDTGVREWYINGVLDYRDDGNDRDDISRANGSQLSFGIRDNNGNIQNPSRIQLDDIRIYSRVLNVDERQALFTNTLATMGGVNNLSGQGTVVGDITIYGNISPNASIGTIAVQGNVALGDAASYTVDVSGGDAHVPGTNSDLLDVTGAVNVAGSLALDLVWIPGAAGNGRFGGTSEILIAAGGVNAWPEDITINSFKAQLASGMVDMPAYIQAKYLPSQDPIELITVDNIGTAITVDLPQLFRGDLNLDGSPNLWDAGIMQDNWKKPGSDQWEQGDINFDDAVNLWDAGMMQDDWKKTYDLPDPVKAAAGSGVPGEGPPAHAVYDFETGEIRITIEETCTFYMFTGESLGNVEKPDNWPEGRPYPFWFPAQMDDSRPLYMGQADWSPAGFPHVTGHVLFLAPAGIEKAEFDLVWQLKDANEWQTWDGVPVEWVPEPATMALLLMGGAVVLVRRRRK